MLEPKFFISLHLAKLIDEISSLRQRIISAPIQVAWKPTLQKETAIRNAMGSTAIEGFVLSLPEVRALASEKRINRNLNVTERAVVNYLAVLRYIHKYAHKEFLTNEDICRLHKIIGEGAVEHKPVGAYRTIQNYIVDGIGRIIYTPPPPEKVPELMNELLEWINNESARYLPVISSGITHYQFVAIHPFVDGNGRVARTLGTWELLRCKFDTLHIFAIDDLIYEHKHSYYSALNTVREEKGALTQWLEFYLEIIAESLERAWKRVISLPKTKELERLSLTPKQEKLLLLLYESGDLTAKEISSILKITVQGVHFLIGPLIKAKIIKRYGGRKTGKFGLVR